MRQVKGERINNEFFSDYKWSSGRPNTLQEAFFIHVSKGRREGESKGVKFASQYYRGIHIFSFSSRVG